VLQNEKYIAFAEDNTVEVLSMGELEKGLKNTGDKRAATYDAKDENGNPVKYLREFAGATAEQLIALNGSPAGQYNKTKSIPYVAIVDPHTGKEMKSLPGGAAAGGLMDAAKEAKDQLNKEHGPSLRRSLLAKVDAAVKSIDAQIGKDNGVAKAFADLKKLQASTEKEHETLKAMVDACSQRLLEAAGKALDDAEGKIAAGDLKGAKSILSPLASVLKGTDLEARVKELLEKVKAEAAPPAK
jgi:hypothetical protein